MFELDSAITNWRNSLLVNQNITDNNVDELESHLRDEVDSLMLSGLSNEEAFMISTHRIGDQQTIDQEFAKVNTTEIWRQRVFWMLSGVFVFMVIDSLSLFLHGLSIMVLAWLKIAPSINGIVSSSIHVLVFIGAVFILVGCLANLSSKIHRRYRTLGNVLWQCLLAIFLLKLLTVFMSVIYAQIYAASEVGQMSVSFGYVLMGWRIIWPLVLAGLLLWLRPSKRQTVR